MGKEPKIINNLPRIGKIAKGTIHDLMSGSSIRAKNGMVEKVNNNGEKRIVLNGRIFPGSTYIDGIKFT